MVVRNIVMLWMNINIDSNITDRSLGFGRRTIGPEIACTEPSLAKKVPTKFMPKMSCTNPFLGKKGPTKFGPCCYFICPKINIT